MFFVRLYGGSFISTFPDISLDRVNLHGIDNLCFPNLELNPHAPVVPGAPGLFFECERVSGERFVRRVFTPWKGDHTWGYMGNYEFIPVASLSPEEYSMQQETVKRHWAKNVLFRAWGLQTFARVYLRRELGREPTPKELADHSTLPERKRIEKLVSIEEIIDAYANGHEQIGIYCMKCIDYDKDWHSFLCKTYPTFLKDEAERREKGSKPRKKGTRHKLADGNQ
ncbi:hypothetical protein QCA50_002349 [Cerrena zonata]|uniref:DUF6697 domain-containing protein n=1 Tax=Cerrena zonata TaxID=2478898 RepID=A0AAW0GTG0_9APHY